MQLTPGDKVKLLNETGAGTVVRLLDKGMVAVLVDGFEFTYPTEQLVKVSDAGSEHATFSGKMPAKPHIQAADPVRLPRPEPRVEQGLPAPDLPKSPAYNPDGVREIDLHIHELVANHRHLTNGEIVALQMEHFRLALEEALAAREHKVVAIHGVGAGVLKAEVRNWVTSMEGMEFQDAPFRYYGLGATEVILH